MLGLAETTPFATEEVSISGKGKICGRLQHFIRPPVQFFLGKLEGGDVLTSRLINGHADVINVVDVIKKLQGSKRVALHLRIIGRIYEDSKTVLVIAYSQGAICNDDAVSGSEALFHPARKIYTLFNQNLRISAAFLGGLYHFKDVGGIAIGTVLHFLVVPGEILRRITGIHTQGPL